MIEFTTVQELVDLSSEKNISMADIIIEYESVHTLRSSLSIIDDMTRIWQTMKESALKGRNCNDKSLSGMVGGDALKFWKYQPHYCGHFVHNVVSNAVAVSETNALMGKIAACPTAGSCGIVPGVLLAAQENYQYTDEEIVKALFVATGIGMVVEHNACIAGAQGGCQAECGTAASMAAAALVYLADGDGEAIKEAAGLALKNLLGLVCDPVAGLVEVPCVKRNGFVAAHAVIAAEMALAGIKSVIPTDEIIGAMYQIGKALPSSLRERATGGLAITPTGQLLKHEIYEE